MADKEPEGSNPPPRPADSSGAFQDGAIQHDAFQTAPSSPATPSQPVTPPVPKESADPASLGGVDLGSRVITPGTAELHLGGSADSALKRAADGIAAGKATVEGVGEAVRAKVRERPVDEMLNDPLREVTRKERRSLLGISAIALLIGWTHARIVPSKIGNFDISFTPPDRGALLGLFFAIVVYYFITFVVYAATDFLKYFHTMAEGAKTLSKHRDEQIMGSLDRAAGTPWWLRFVVPASLVRGVFDFFITLVIAVYAMLSLWGAVPQAATTAPSATAPPAVAPVVPHGTTSTLKVIPHR